MAFVQGDATVTIQVSDSDNRTSSIGPIRLPSGATFAELEAYALGVAALVTAVVDVAVGDVVLTVPAVPDESATPLILPGANSEVERKAVFVFDTEQPGHIVTIALPTLDNNGDDGGSPPQRILDPTDNRTINQLNAYVASFVTRLIAPATPVATTVYGASNNAKRYLFAELRAAYKQHTESLAGEQGGAGSGRQIG